MPRVIIPILVLCFALGAAADEVRKPLTADEQVRWFPGVATQTNDQWEVTLHGLITEEESRPAVSWLARRMLGFSDSQLSQEERAQFLARSRWFLADDESRKRITVEIAGQRIDLGRTKGNGHFSGRMLVQTNFSERTSFLPCVVSVNDRYVTNQAPVCVIPRHGISVISDIDDTIKFSDVLVRPELLRNTFLRPFRAIDGMAGVYQRWAASSNVCFHYLSGSPWQLFPALEEFARTNAFPNGSWHLRSVRLTDRTVRELLKTPDEHKLEQIEKLVTRLPERQFVLVGDSGERDPEIYGAAARRFPTRIKLILIRDVTNESSASERHKKAFREVPAPKWRIFKSADELPPTW